MYPYLNHIMICKFYNCFSIVKDWNSDLLTRSLARYHFTNFPCKVMNWIKHEFNITWELGVVVTYPTSNPKVHGSIPVYTKVFASAWYCLNFVWFQWGHTCHIMTLYDFQLTTRGVRTVGSRPTWNIQMKHKNRRKRVRTTSFQSALPKQCGWRSSQYKYINGELSKNQQQVNK